jgi:hypothetical protein
MLEVIHKQERYRIIAASFEVSFKELTIRVYS